MMSSSQTKWCNMLTVSNKAKIGLFLGRISSCLSHICRFTEARDSAIDAVSLFRSLVAQDPASYTPDLARNLGNLGIDLSKLNRHMESLDATQESIKLFLSLIAHDPASYTPYLAHNLGNLGSHLSNLNRHMESL